jgi:hypothetical protein
LFEYNKPGQLKLQVLTITNPDIAELAGRLPAGRVHANGRGFVPYIRRDLYTKLLAAAGTSGQGEQSPVPAAAVGRPDWRHVLPAVARPSGHAQNRTA